jgi:hypothetical protein
VFCLNFFGKNLAKVLRGVVLLFAFVIGIVQHLFNSQQEVEGCLGQNFVVEAQAY